MPSLILLLAYSVLLLAHSGYTQDFSIPSTWLVSRTTLLGVDLHKINMTAQNTTTHISRPQRIDLAQAALRRAYDEKYDKGGEFKGTHMIPHPVYIPVLINI